MKIQITKLDALFSRYIRTRAGWKCERCGGGPYNPPTTALHCAHFHGRAKKSTRHDPDNAASLCMGCHLYMHGHPLECVQWFRNRLGQHRFDLLTIRANTPKKMDWGLLEIGLTALLKDLEVGKKT